MTGYKKIWNRLIILLLCLIANNCRIISQSKFLSIDDRKEYPVFQYLTYYSDTHQHSIDSIKKKDDSDLFKLFPSPIMNVGFTNKYYWVSLKIYNSLSVPNKVMWVCSNNTINHMEVFKYTGKGFVSLGVTGDHYDFSQRPYFSNLFVYPLQLNPNETASYYAFIDKKDENLKLAFGLVSEDKFDEMQVYNYLKIGVYAGILLIVFFFNIFLQFSLKDSIHGWYALYMLVCLYNLFAFEGMDFQFFYPHFTAMNDIAKFVSTALNLFLMLFIMQRFLNQSKINSSYFVAAKIIQWNSLFMILCVLIIYKIVPSSLYSKKIITLVFSCNAIIGFVIIALSSVEKIKQGFKPALFYMFALTPLVFGTIDFILNLFGAFTNFNRNFNPITLGLVFESVIISFGILYRYNLFKKEKELLAIELSEQKAITTNKVIEAQELERKRIAQDLHDELGGDLATIKINLQNALNEDTAIVNALSLLDKASSDLRNISHNLMPPDFSKMRLNENLISLYKELNQRSIIYFNFISNFSNPVFKEHTELIIYRTLVELTNNIIKHSKATEATIQTIYHEEHLSITVEDNGTGFINKGLSDGIGLKNVQSRVDYLNGSINIDSNNTGVTVIIEIPYKI